MTTSPRLSIARLMAIIAVIAADLAAIAATLPRIPNPGLALMVVVLEVGLFRLADDRWPGRAFWLGFEILGWAYVLLGFAYDRSAWALARSLFETHVLGRTIARPGDLWGVILFAGVLQLILSGAVALAGGCLLHAAMRGRRPGSDGSVS